MIPTWGWIILIIFIVVFQGLVARFFLIRYKRRIQQIGQERRRSSYQQETLSPQVQALDLPINTRKKGTIQKSHSSVFNSSNSLITPSTSQPRLHPRSKTSERSLQNNSSVYGKRIQTASALNSAATLSNITWKDISSTPDIDQTWKERVKQAQPRIDTGLRRKPGAVSPADLGPDDLQDEQNNT